MLSFRDATTDDSALLTATSVASKRHWGYDQALLELWKLELEISDGYIRNNTVMLAFDETKFVGFFAILISEKSAELDHLWLVPDLIGNGYGSQIFNFVKSYLAERDIEDFTLVAEPNAKGFYDKMNGVPTASFESKIPGRFLEIYTFKTS